VLRLDTNVSDDLTASEQNQPWHTSTLGSLLRASRHQNPGQENRMYETHHREGMEIELYPDNTSREEGFSLSKTWKPLFQTLKEERKNALSKEE